MNSLMDALIKLIRKRYALFKNFIIGLLLLSLSGCVSKATSQDISIQLSEQPIRQKNAQLSSKISEVAPPEIIQELHQSLEVYQPQVKILSPKPDEVLKEDKLKVSFQVKDLPIFKDATYKLGSHLEIILDNQPELEIYDLNQPLEFSNLSPGTHTLRVFASRPWHESFKNEGAYAQTTFHVFTKSDDNNPDKNLPILTYNSPEGNYGAEPILLDFYLTNAPLHILAKENPDNLMADWRIRCTINGESFIIDRWQSLYLKGFNSGQNWVKLEFLDNQGNPVKNVYNSTVKVINYQPKGTDTLAKIVRGELAAEDVRGILDTDYAVKIPTEAKSKQQLEEKSDNGGFFDRFKRGKEDKIPTPQPTLEATPEIIETPETETSEPEKTLEETTPQVIETPQAETNLDKSEVEVTPIPQSEKSKSDGFLNRFQRGQEDKTIMEQPTVEATPEIIETPQPENTLEETTPEIIETLTPESQINEVVPEVKVTTEVLTNETEIVEPLENQPSVTQPEITEPQIEVNPEAKQSVTKRLGEYFNSHRRTTSVPTPEIVPEVDEVEIKAVPEQKQETAVPEIPSRTEIVP